MEKNIITINEHQLRGVIREELEQLLIEEGVTSLSEIEVVAERSTFEQKIDRKVINVAQELINTGQTASDL